MLRLQFNRIRICSESEQKAVTQTFHPRRTLLWGENGVGKSTILKSLYRAFDAEPQGELRDWDYEAIVAVDFTVDGHPFTALRRGDLRAMYRGQELIGAAASSADWNRIFAKTVGFKLQLLDRGGTFRPAAPSNYFLPFFVNQDGSFGGAWETFKSLKQFDKSVDYTLDYFVQVHPTDYFELKAKAQLEKVKAAELKVELATLERTRARLRRNQRKTPVKLHAKDFQLEIQQLTDLSVDLVKKQDALRKSIVQEQELAFALREQIRLSAAALKEHSADFKFAGEAAVMEKPFVCPTCHAEHDASFHTLLGLAEDARQLLSLKTTLEDDLDGVEERLARHRRVATDLKQKYADVEQVLTVKRGRFTFDDFIKSYSAAEADSQLAAEQRVVEVEIETIARTILSIKVDLAALAAEHDPKAPVAAFRQHFAQACVKLDVKAPDGIDNWRLAKRPVESGSRNARALIAYYSALWSSVARDGYLPVPVVIDSPNQGAQDRPHLKQMLANIAAMAPRNAQVILAHEERPDVFDADLVVHLTAKERVLTEEAFVELHPELFSYVQRARSSLAGMAVQADEDFSDDEG